MGTLAGPLRNVSHSLQGDLRRNAVMWGLIATRQFVRGWSRGKHLNARAFLPSLLDAREAAALSVTAREAVTALRDLIEEAIARQRVINLPLVAACIVVGALVAKLG